MIDAPAKPSCPACGTTIDTASLDGARQRIHQLEEQAELLKAKTAAAGMETIHSFFTTYSR